MSRSALPVFPRLPSAWTLESWRTWAGKTIETITDQLAIIRRDSEVSGEPRRLPPATVQQLTVDSPPKFRPIPDGLMVFCSDATGGGVPVYSRGGQWLRVDDNTVVS